MPQRNLPTTCEIRHPAVLDTIFRCFIKSIPMLQSILTDICAMCGSELYNPFWNQFFSHKISIPKNLHPSFSNKELLWRKSVDKSEQEPLKCWTWNWHTSRQGRALKSTENNFELQNFSIFTIALHGTECGSLFIGRWFSSECSR
jgi:hypothetical protein